MVEALRQFDANGNPVLAGGGGGTGATPVKLNHESLLKPSTDILASGKS